MPRIEVGRYYRYVGAFGAFLAACGPPFLLAAPYSSEQVLDLMITQLERELLFYFVRKGAFRAESGLGIVFDDPSKSAGMGQVFSGSETP